MIKISGNYFYAPATSHPNLLIIPKRSDFVVSCFFPYKSDCQFTQTNESERHQSVIGVGALNPLGEKASYSGTASSLWITGLGGGLGNNFDQNDSAAIVTTKMSFLCSEYADLNNYDVDTDTYFGTYFRKVIDTTCKYTSTMNGTSAAAPTITGIVALMKEVNKDLTVPQVKYILAKSARNDKSE